MVLSIEHAEELFPMRPEIVDACAKKIATFGAVLVELLDGWLAADEGRTFRLLALENGIDCARRGARPQTKGVST